MLLQHKNAILLQNATKLYYKMRQVFYCKMSLLYKMWQLFQNMTILLQNATILIKCNVYYKMRRYKR